MLLDIITKYYIEIIGIILSSVITYLIQRAVILKNRIGVYHPAILSILRNEIIKVHYKHVSSDSLISRAVFQSVEDMYENYKSLGGNGYVDKCMKEIEKLELIK